MRLSDADRLRQAMPEHGVGKLVYLPHLDGLRAIAIATVVLYHAWPASMPGGFIGVDVFFVISGFLITRIIASEMADGRFSFVEFLARRVRRLVPASFVMLAVVLAVGVVVLRPDTLKSLGLAVLYTCGLLANVLFYYTAGYFSSPPEEKPILHMWSLAVEDQFYLTWPLLLLLLSYYLPRNRIVLVASVLAVVSLVHAQMKLGADPDYSFYMLPARAWELLVGCLLALVAPHVSFRGWTGVVAAWTGLVAIVASALFLNTSVPFPGLSAVPAVLGTALVIAAGLRDENGAVRVLSAPPVVFVGLISYSLYLWHWPILSMSHYALGQPLTGIEVFGALLVSVVVATASWRYVERPFRKPKGDTQENSLRTLAAGVGILVPVFLVGGLFKISDGLPTRFGGAAGEIYSDLALGNPLRASCDGFDHIRGNDAVCNFGRKLIAGASYDVAVFGDSNADHFVPGFAKWVAVHDLSARQVTQSACALLLNVIRPGMRASHVKECDAYRRAALQFVDDNPHLKLAVLGGHWRSYLSVRDLGAVAGDGLVPVTWTASQVKGVEAFELAMGRTVDYFLARGIKVHIIAQIPQFKSLSVGCVVRAVNEGGDARTCGISRKAYETAQGAIDEALRRIAAARRNVSVSYPSKLICDDAYCSPYRDGVFLYRNGSHLSEAGALKIGEILGLPDLR